MMLKIQKIPSIRNRRRIYTSKIIKKKKSHINIKLIHFLFGSEFKIKRILKLVMIIIKTSTSEYNFSLILSCQSLVKECMLKVIYY